MCSDISGFAEAVMTREAKEVVALVDKVVELFDGLAALNELVKVETMGDCICCVGLPETAEMKGKQHDGMAAMAMALQLTRLEVEGKAVELRVGLAGGCVVAGVFEGVRGRSD